MTLPYPLKDIDRDLWLKKVNSTLMITVPAEDQALPILHELDAILTRLITQPVQQTLDESVVEYFFTGVFPTVCCKIIRSRYFKSNEVLKISNSVLQKSIYLIPIHFTLVLKFPKTLDILTTVFSEESYFKTNNQLSYMLYPYSYFPQPNKENPELKVGDFVDILKIGNLYEKVTWSQGQVVEVFEYDVQVAYLYDKIDKKIKVKKDSPQLAPFKSKSHTFQWRMAIKKGDLVDVQDSFGTWYNATVLQVVEKQEGKKNVNVTLKVYNENGNKQDEGGKYFGFSEYEETYDFTSPKIAPYCTVAKEFSYESSKVSSYDAVQDLNDYEFPEINGTIIYALPRRKHLSQLIFQTINGFGELGGFDKFMKYLEEEVNFDIFCAFLKGVSGVSAYLNRKIVRELVVKFKALFEKYLFQNAQRTAKKFTKQMSEMAFSGLKALQKRLFSNENVSKYENTIKMKLVSLCLQSEAIKNKLQGLNELKDIVRNVIHSGQRYNYIKQWVKCSKIFDKIYLIDSHVQLIKKSQQFFKYLINQNILQVTDLQKLYRMAQKGDFESRVSIYKLFQEVSHIFKKQHVEFLIDTILQSELHLILNEDIDLLNQLSRYSNYFPLEKVIAFFENIILGDNKVKELHEYAIKKYSQMIARSHQMRTQRRRIISGFIQKLSTHDVSKVTKILKGIFDCTKGTLQQWKKDVHELISEQKLDEVSVRVLKKAENTPQFSKSVTVILDFLLFLYKLTQRIKINVQLIIQIWGMVEGNPEKVAQFYKWFNELSKCDQGLSEHTQLLEDFASRVFPAQLLPKLTGVQSQLAKNIFLELNKKAKYIAVCTTYKQKEFEKDYKRKVQMKSLKLIDLLIKMIYENQSEAISTQMMKFFTLLYISKQNPQEQVNQIMTKLLKDFQAQYETKNYHFLSQTIKFLQLMINDSEKYIETTVKSLISKKEPDYARFIIINEISYISSESSKKTEMVLPMNTSVIKLRKILAKEFNLSWQEVKIVSDREIQDYNNSRTLKQIKLNPNQPLTITRRIILSQVQEQIIINNRLSPKAERVFRIIFERYSTDGKMNKDQCNGFTSLCLGSSCSTKYYNQKIASLYEKYDDDKDGLLTVDNFLSFYQDAAKDRPPTVWSNLRSFGVRNDLKFNDEPEQNRELSEYPRSMIAKHPKVYDILFDVLHNKEVASVAFQLLERLQISPSIEADLMSIESNEDLKAILETPDPYQLYYKLCLIQYLVHSKDLQTEAQKKWHAKFIELQGYEMLYKCVQRIIEQEKNKMKQNATSENEIIREIIETGLNLLNEYWTECLTMDSKKTRTSLSYIHADEDIDEKMDYIIFGRFFKSNRKIEPQQSKLPKQIEQYNWKGQYKQKIRQTLLKQFKDKWLQISNLDKQKASQKKYNLTMVIWKIIDSINILTLNENPHGLVEVISTLFDTTPNIQLTRRIYYLILSQCFFCSEEKYQDIFVKELFKNLTKRTITSEHFRVLALLVSRFGVVNTEEEQGGEYWEKTEKLKQVLFTNVLTNTNQLTVEGCAKLLTNFSLYDTPYEIFEKIWDGRLLNPSTICEKQQTKSALFELILKICDNNIELTNKIILKIVSQLEKQIKNMKISSCNQFKQRSGAGFVGLKNLGNTCYINSMIQQLFMNKNFRYLILRADDSQPPNLIPTVDSKNQLRQVDDNFLHQFQRILAYLESSNRIDYNARDFCVAYKPFGNESVNVMVQQDVQEFVSMFFQRLEAGLAKTPFKKVVDDFYTGKTTNLFKCHSCQETKKVQQSFYSISLEVKTSKTLAESFNRFCHGEMISEYTCDFCQNKVDVTKKTRISRPPKVLIIHLQRIVFNLDTFINQKITTKHSFPQKFNLHQASLDYYEKSEAGQTEIQEPKQYNYNLIGIICHSGNAEAGHYISYIKAADNKWLEFNDTQVLTFNPNNIEAECFGGYFASSTFDDDFYDDKKESSKSAYLLIYEKEGENTIQLLLNEKIELCKNQKEKNKVKEKLLDTLDLKEVVRKVTEKKGMEEEKFEEESSKMQSQKDNAMNEQSSQAPQDSENETKKLLLQKQLQIKRSQSEDNIEVQMTQTEAPAIKSDKQVVALIQTPISPYIPQHLKNQVIKDNEIHFLQKCLSSSAFIKFFASLLSKPNTLHNEVLPLCQKLAFGFWLKSTAFKDLLNMIDDLLKRYPEGFETIVTNNPLIFTLLIETSDADVRTAMANFLPKVIAQAISSKNISIHTHNDDPIFKFLDKLLSLLPSTVSKSWTKFSQYFEFWYQLSSKGEALVEYMISRQIIKHFMDYFLDTKSPLKIYSTKRQHAIGSSYASPNFTMLLKCVFSLLQQRIILNSKNKQKDNKGPLSMSPEEEILLMSFDSLEKLINDNYESIACQLVKQICPNNLAASQKAAIVILKGIQKSNSESIQPYLQVLHNFIKIEDQHQDLRIKWVIGKQTLAVSNISLKIIGLNSYSLDERLHYYESSIHIESGSSLLETIITQHKRMENFAMLCTKELLKLCDESTKFRRFIFTLQSPTLQAARFTDFFKGFIDKYYDDGKKSFGFYTSSSGFNREQFAKQVKKLYESVIKKVEEDQQLQKIIKQPQIDIKLKEKQELKAQNKQQTHEKQNLQNQSSQNTKQTKQDTNNNKPEIQNSKYQQFVELKPINRKKRLVVKYSVDISPDIVEQEDVSDEDDDSNSLDFYKNEKNTSGPNSNSVKNDYDYFENDEYQIKFTKSSSNENNIVHISDQQNESQEQTSPPPKKNSIPQHSQTKQKKDYRLAWHPIKFDYTPIKTLPETPKHRSLQIEQHLSTVTYLLTRPTGFTNRAFTSSGGIQKISDRMYEDTWENQKKVQVHGFYVKNNGKESIRMQTDDGCIYCKAGECVFVWADEIVRVWEAERSIDWPKWRLYQDNK